VGAGSVLFYSCLLEHFSTPLEKKGKKKEGGRRVRRRQQFVRGTCPSRSRTAGFAIATRDFFYLGGGGRKEKKGEKKKKEKMEEEIRPEKITCRAVALASDRGQAPSINPSEGERGEKGEEKKKVERRE